jgi:hypothetical protein
MITLQTINLSFSENFEFPAQDYLEYCTEYKITPSQKHYKKLITEMFVDYLLDDIDDSKFVFEYEEPQEYEFEELEETAETFDHNQYLSDLDENEINEFHLLCETDKMSINPSYTKNDIIIMNSVENPSMNYGVKIDKETGEILYIKKSIYAYHLYEWLRTL